MKIGIVYGTRRKAATAEIVSWIAGSFESLGHTVVSAKPDEFDHVDCDLYVLGTAVYAFSTGRAGIPAFIRKNRTTFSKRPTAVFIVCGADPLNPDSAEGGLKRALKKSFLDPEKYMASVTGLLPESPIETAFFKGYQEPEDREKTSFDAQRERVTAWCSAVLAACDNAPAR